MTVALPDTIPSPLAAGSAFKQSSLARNRQRDAGEDRRRRLYTSAPEEASVAWLLLQSEFDALDEFYDDTINSGADPFFIKLRLRGEVNGLEWFKVLWADEFKYTVTKGSGGLHYAVTARLTLLASYGSTEGSPSVPS